MPDTSHCCCGSDDMHCLQFYLPCSGDPAAGETVTVSGPGGFSASLTTDADGRACFAVPTTGSYTIGLTSAAPGVAPYSATFTIPAGNVGTAHIELPLDPDYWCPCPFICGDPAIEPIGFEFEAFGQVKPANPSVGFGPYADFAVPEYCDPYGNPSGGTVNVRVIYGTGGDCTFDVFIGKDGFFAQYVPLASGELGVSCDPFAVSWSPSYPLYWFGGCYPGPVGSLIAFRGVYA